MSADPRENPEWAETFRAIRRTILAPAESVTPSAEESDE